MPLKVSSHCCMALACSGRSSNASGSCHSTAFPGECPSSQEHQEFQAAGKKPSAQAVPHLVRLSSHPGSTTNISPGLQPPLLSHHSASPSPLTLPQVHPLPFSLLFPPRPFVTLHLYKSSLTYFAPVWEHQSP